jgi:hypothetical protein
MIEFLRGIGPGERLMMTDIARRSLEDPTRTRPTPRSTSVTN